MIRKTISKHISALALAASASLLLGSCSSHYPQNLLASSPSADQHENSLTAMPLPGEVRSASAGTPTLRYLAGSNYDSLLPFQNIQGVGYPGMGPGPLYWEVALDPELEGQSLASYAFAGFRFNNPSLPGQAALGKLQLSKTMPEVGGRAFVGLANFQKNRWDWYQPDSNGWFGFGSWNQYLQPETGEVWVVVLLSPGEPCLIEYVLLGGPYAPSVEWLAAPSNGENPYAFKAPLDFHYAARTRAPGNEPVLYDYDFDGDGWWDVWDSPDGTANRLYDQAGDYATLLRVTGADGQSATGQVSFTVAPETSPPPVVQLSVTPDSGAAPLTVTADASGSTDDWLITRYEWDLDGDGYYEVPFGSPVMTTTLALKGPATVSVRVWDDYWQSSEASAAVTLSSGFAAVETGFEAPGYYYIPAAMTGPHGAEVPSLLIGPAFKQALDAQGTSWPVIAQDTGIYGRELLALADGRPGIFHLRGGGFEHTWLCFRAATDTSGTAFAGSIDLASMNDPSSLSACLVDGRPAVAAVTWRDSGGTWIGSYESTNPEGTSWKLAAKDLIPVRSSQAALIGVGSGAQAGLRLAFMSVMLDGAVSLAKPGTGYPGNWGIFAVPPIASSVTPAFADIGGRPAIAYSGLTNGGWGFARANDALGLDWPDAPVAIPGPSAGSEILKLTQTGACISMLSSTNGGELWYCRSTDATGSNWEPAIRLFNNPGSWYTGCNLLSSAGQPILFFVKDGKLLCAHWEE